MVWLHGWARRGADFAAAATALAERGFASVALDLPGCGASPAPLVAGGARHYADLILPTLREIAEEPIVLVGHSRGGCIAVVAASRHPELTHALVVSGAPLVRATSSALSPLAYRTLRSLARRRLVSPRRLEAARNKYGSTDYRNAEGVMRNVLVASVNESYESELTLLAMPVTFVWGENDHEVPVDVARRAMELTEGPTSLTVLDGVGHLVPLEAPTALMDAAEKALRQ